MYVDQYAFDILERVYIASITKSLDKNINAEDYGVEKVPLPP